MRSSRSAASAPASCQLGCLRVEPLGCQHREADEIEPVAGVEPFLADRRDPLAEQPGHGERIPQRAARADVNVLDGAVDAKQRDIEPARALAVAGEQAADVVGEGQDR